jgi:hypothetical protein
MSDFPVRHKMAYIGHEPERETLKYRYPAKHEGWECPMSKVCSAGKSYGKTVRVPREVDFFRFPALPRRDGTLGKIGLSPTAAALRAKAKATPLESAVAV